MARFDGNLKAAGEAKLDVDELLSALGAASNLGREERQDAIACFLSVSEGWKDARATLKGTFATMPRPSWLTGNKD
ncbi:hypothetical protein LZ518_08245 [Sphingomonas sp. RB56-2]|uniref:Uncharacterized protein n=1 Tax=Sphingomonas brevis TaxID=2908206 RepID=A0ABT0SAF7_9SPHN|nr:hypothetical protein [Sphingomonas brevis]MCL6741119.1 hypothetical protein [Sphingomonas brevis]